MTSPFFGPILLGRFPVERFPEKIFLGRVGPEAKRATTTLRQGIVRWGEIS
jgi:hypothetical protein